MKKLLALIWIAGSIAAAAQTPANFLGTKTLYSSPAAVTYTPAPAGYQPVFINYVGRHGARHLTKQVSASFAYATLLKADSVHALTAKGQKLLQMVIALDKVEKGNVKSISAEGKEELQGIGRRMYANCPQVFANGASLNVTETNEIRTKQSADAFLSGLKANLKTEPVIKEYQDDVNLRFYDLSPAYDQFVEAGDWLKYREAIATEVKLVQMNEEFMQSIFTESFLKTMKAGAKEKFVNDVFGFAAITYSVKAETEKAGYTLANIAFIDLFTPAQIKALGELDLADDYYKKGPGINNNGIQVRIAAPLLANFIKTADGFITSHTYNAQLRFAHAETISPIAALMGISTADKSTTTGNIGAYWQASKVIPLSSNIQWIFYKKGANYLVKILLNEKEARITGLHTQNPPYYKWAELREFYTRKLKTLNVGLDDDMAVYLKNVK